MKTELTPYDQNAYPGYPYAQTHPDRLATMARLYGLSPAPVERCRVLELGCGNGSNLIPMALQLPGSQFLGIDLASSAIQVGQQLVAELGLSNIQLRHCDLLEYVDESAPYDYILAHGLYSWVPPAVQERILEIVYSCLAANGVAYLSYNSLPGGHFRLMMREMMQYHVRSLESTEEKVHQGKSLIYFLTNAQIKPNSYAMLLKDEWEHRLSKRAPSVLIHDELGEFNENLYFHEFISRASKHRLQFLAEADFPEMHASNFEPHVGEMFLQLGEDIVAREQYMDFLRGRRFRQTLLCHDALQIVRQIPMERITTLLAASSAKPSAPLFEPETSSPVQFLGPHGTSITASHPLVKAALYCMEENWPLPLPFEKIRELALSHLSKSGIGVAKFDSAEDRAALSKTIFLCYGSGLLELHTWAPQLVVKPGDRPRASSLARIQAGRDDRLTTLIHTSVEVAGALEKKMLRLLDGTRDRSSILSSLESAVLAGEVALAENGKPVSDPLCVRHFLESGLQTQLENLGKLGLIVS